MIKVSFKRLKKLLFFLIERRETLLYSERCTMYIIHSEQIAPHGSRRFSMFNVVNRAFFSLNGRLLEITSIVKFIDDCLFDVL